jgi:hypothetical protein
VKVSELPDIKVIRTGFIINFVFIVLMLTVGFYVLQREYRAHALGQTIADMEQRILIAGADDSASLKLSVKFRAEAAHIAEIEKFYAAPFLVQDFLVQITQMRPEQLIFKQLSVIESAQKEGTSQVVIYRINVTGEVRALTVLDQFKGALSELGLFNYPGYVLEIDETLQGRDAETGIFPYTLQITLQPEKASPAADA